MTHTLPIQVIHRQVDRSDPVDITPWITNLEFRSTSPGGYSNASFTLNIPLAGLPIEYTQYSRIDIVNTASSTVLWQGLARDPGRTSGPDGQSFNMTAVGVSSTLKDINIPYVGIDSSLDGFGRGAPPIMQEGCSVSVDVDAAVGGAGLLFTLTPGTVAFGGIGYVTYLPMTQSGQQIGSFCATDIESGQGSGFVFGYVAATGIAASHAWSPTAVANELLAGVHFGDTNYMHMSWENSSGPATEVGQDCWTRVGRTIVKPKLYDKSGSLVIAPPTTYTTWFEIVNDMLGGSGRMILVDGPAAFLDTGGPAPVHIDHFAFPDGVTCQEIFDELLTKEPIYTWLITAELPSGKYLFVWERRPTAVAYDADLDFEYIDCPGTITDLYNALVVRWRDEMGNIRSSRFTSSVPMLSAAGLTRSFILDLGDNVEATGATVASTAAAFLAEHAFPTRAGTLTVSRPLFNDLTDEWVDPWELGPPFLIRVPGTTPGAPGDERDGTTVFECVGVTYRTADATATLDLEQRPRTLPNQAAGFRPPGRRR